jgi:hypothetical protein
MLIRYLQILIDMLYSTYEVKYALLFGLLYIYFIQINSANIN